jgi:ornithine cyclodeaminase/alanine dehydrogenase-like protein (mu-crystallin family)
MLMLDERQVDAALTWDHVLTAMRQGHAKPKPELGDTLLAQPPNTILVRTAWIAGMGLAVKSATIFPGNTSMPSIQGLVSVFDKDNGSVTALIDAVSVTRWKTAGDSALGSSLLSRADSRQLLMVGAGTMAEPLIRAHISVRPSIDSIAIWNRSVSRAEALVQRLSDLGRPVRIATDLEAAVRAADVISVATMATEPIVPGAWLKPGAHLDLVGAYRLDMRETDDEAMRRGRLFVDYRGTTIEHIGEIAIPIAGGVITAQSVLGDLYDLVPGTVAGRTSPHDITIYKNGGGAHLDLMTSHAILAAAANA